MEVAGGIANIQISITMGTFRGSSPLITKSTVSEVELLLQPGFNNKNKPQEDGADSLPFAARK